MIHPKRGYDIAMTTSDAIIRLRELIGDTRVGMLTTSTASAELHSRPLTVAEIDDSGNLNVIVDSESDWVQGMRAGEAVNLSIANDDDKVWVSIAGTAAVHEDRATIHRLWSPAADLFFPEGAESPTARVLVLTATTADFWDAPSSKVQRLAVMAKAVLGDASAKLGDSGSIDLK